VMKYPGEWMALGHGAVNEAVALFLAAAETASANG
jgi:hypothetical protein